MSRNEGVYIYKYYLYMYIHTTRMDNVEGSGLIFGLLGVAHGTVEEPTGAVAVAVAFLGYCPHPVTPGR